MAIAPYALAASMLIAVDIMAIVALPHAEQFKPIPPLAAVIQRERRPGDVVAIQSFRGANALVFYTEPPVYGIAPPGSTKSKEGPDPRSVICTHPRVWLVAPAKRPAVDPLYGRTRREIATAGSGALFLIDGPPCHS